MVKKSFLLHVDSLDVLDELTDEQAGKLFKSIKAYHDGTQIECDCITKIAFSPFKNQFSRDQEKYLALCEKNRLIAENRYKNKSTKSTTGKSGNQTLPKSTKSTDNDNDSDSDSDSDKEKTKDKDLVKKQTAREPKKRFTPPTLDEIKTYVLEKGLEFVDPETFFYHYEQNDWMVSKAKMKSWTRALSGWNARGKNEKSKGTNGRNRKTAASAAEELRLSLGEDDDFFGGGSRSTQDQDGSVVASYD